MLGLNHASEVLRIALSKYEPAARSRVQEEVCQRCPDQKCLAGSYCRTYDLLFTAYLWEQVEDSAWRN
jgi:hypothetical protein